VYNDTFNNISVISLVEEIRLPGENHRPVIKNFIEINLPPTPGQTVFALSVQCCVLSKIAVIFSFHCLLF
jgi:hypothetical protein